ncbi:MAG: hypothetical protein A3I72_05265 [Candidatus Tectomicrobia bacterium RIFCSPLOWO2_02_FULL_70_19]|nr:MAG: hypothetical protein A3I72_05265 [Candidatus Tectomicrobia bacterium RIFCSPLOWO2_02_FULL_70_19]
MSVWCDVAFTPAEIPIRLTDARRARGAAPGEVLCAVIDVLRATTTIVSAMGNGCRAIHPVPSPQAGREKAAALRAGLGAGQVILGGEQDGRPIEGYDAGNSPLEYTPERAGGRVLVLSTSNGTKTLAAAAPCGRVYIAAFANLRAAGRRLAGDLRAGQGKTLLIGCSGREGGFCEEDAVAAGMLLAHAREGLGGEVELSDTAKAALRTAEGSHRDLPRLLRESFWGRHLTALGMAADIAFCGRLDWTEAIPRLRDGVIVAGQ